MCAMRPKKEELGLAVVIGFPRTLAVAGVSKPAAPLAVFLASSSVSSATTRFGRDAGLVAVGCPAAVVGCIAFSSSASLLVIPPS